MRFWDLAESQVCLSPPRYTSCCTNGQYTGSGRFALQPNEVSFRKKELSCHSSFGEGGMYPGALRWDRPCRCDGNLVGQKVDPAAALPACLSSP